MSRVDYLERIPNNVNLHDNRRLQRALEEWQPRYLEWWKAMGPEGYQATEVYLRTAISVDPQGWAQFGYVTMPDYRWGIFLAEPEPSRVVPFGDHKGQPAWQEVPGEYRGTLRRLVVTQGDTEPASVEQQRHLGRTCPSLYDLRNLFQVNVEEGRHLWAMVYLLQAYFGRDGREEAEALLERRSGDRDKPRILGAFNEQTPDWLAYFMFTFFTDRDGKYQLASLCESGFDPLSRTCRFMLTEEAHHMFVGETGIGRVVQRACELMREHRTDDVRKFGAIDLATVQRYLNFHYSVSLDLFGSEISTNAANFYTMGLKGRFEETKKDDDHRLQHATYRVLTLEGDVIGAAELPALTTLNERLRDDYIADCQRGVDRWNAVIRRHGIDRELKLPHRAFHRAIGQFAEVRVSPDGRLLSEAEWDARHDEWLPTAEDRAFVGSLMQPVIEPGKFAGWIAPPARGINSLPVDHEYVKLGRLGAAATD
jgi:benzoyl-CoA 2,3-dioxygenase component B